MTKDPRRDNINNKNRQLIKYGGEDNIEASKALKVKTAYEIDKYNNKKHSSNS